MNAAGTQPAAQRNPEKKCMNKCADCQKKKKENHVHGVGKKIITLLLMVVSTAVLAQDGSKPVLPFRDDPFNHPMLPFYIVLFFIGVVIILVALVSIYLVKVVNLFISEAEKERARQLGITYQPKPAWWNKFLKRVNASVPVDEESSIEIDHSYDGIKELDNHLPPWWKWLFVGTVIWGVIYFIAYHAGGNLPLQLEEYENELVYAEEQARKIKASQPQAVIDEEALVYTADAEILAGGKSVFLMNCVACHGPSGEGNSIGPNLTDEYWLHKGSVKDIFSTVKKGVVDKGMPAWGKTMSPKDVRDVTFYVMSLQGSKPANPKAPQGELFKPEPVPPDSVKTQAAL